MNARWQSTKIFAVTHAYAVEVGTRGFPTQSLLTLVSRLGLGSRTRNVMCMACVRLWRLPQCRFGGGRMTVTGNYLNCE